MKIERPVLGQITQGSVFSGAKAESYADKPVWGLCITARCDMAHEKKTDIFNYIPVVRYEDWLLDDGAKIILDRILNDLEARFKVKLKNCEKSESVLEAYAPRTIVDILFPETDGKQKKDRDYLLDLSAAMEKIKMVRISLPANLDSLKNCLEGARKIFDSFVKELFSNQLSGYYFLSNVGDTEFESAFGYVALLREIHHIPRQTAKSIASGVEKPENYDSVLQSIPNYSVFDFSMVVGKVASPWMEHIMQQFSLLFSRIGLPDPALTLLANLQKYAAHE